jgi:SM-20-related protein
LFRDDPVTPPHLVIDDILSAAERDALLAWALANQQRFRPAEVEQGVVADARVGGVLRDLGPFEPIFAQRLMSHAEAWTAALRLSAFTPSQVELEMAASGDGAFFTLHTDTYRTDRPTRGDRMISAIYYFHRAPAAFTGGTLRLHGLAARPGDRGWDIAPTCGRLLVFPAWWPHEVLPVQCPTRQFADSRFSVTGWVHRARSGPEA